MRPATSSPWLEDPDAQLLCRPFDPAGRVVGRPPGCRRAGLQRQGSEQVPALPVLRRSQIVRQAQVGREGAVGPAALPAADAITVILQRNPLGGHRGSRR